MVVVVVVVWSYSNYTDVIERRDWTVIFPNLTRSYRDFAYMLAWFSCSHSYIDLYSACSAMILIESGCGSSREEGGVVKQRVGLFHGACMVLLKIHFETVSTKWWYFQKYFPRVCIVRLKNLTVTRINKINRFSVFCIVVGSVWRLFLLHWSIYETRGPFFYDFI